MDPFVAGFWAAEDGGSRARFSQLARIHAPGWGLAAGGTGYGVLTRKAGGLAVRQFPLGLGVVVGDLFHRDPLDRAFDHLGAFSDVGTAARALIDTAWGRYVALFPDPVSGQPAVLRSPGGALEAFAWRCGGLTLVASQLEDAPIELDRDVGIDWERLGRMLRDNTEVGGALALRGVEAVEPGVLWRSGGAALTLWDPASYAHGEASPMGAREEIPRRVDGCVAALAQGAGRVVAEISGGLDSAIVASALAKAPAVEVAAWLNHHVAGGPGDERTYARAVADRLGLSLTERPLSEDRLDLAVLAHYARGARPSLTGLDQAYDRATADLAAAAGAKAILTGQGGDTVFFQIPTPLIVADHLQREGWRGLFSPVTGDVARWTKRSAWSVLAAAAGALAGFPDRQVRAPPGFLTRALREAPRPPPAPANLTIPPAKRRQLQGLRNTRLFLGACARSRQLDLIHPLLSQPIVEYLLSLSSVDLTQGGRDRALVRGAFADRLPAVVIARRSKGVLSSHYEQLLAASLTEVRPYLLEGRLAREGLLDRPRLEAMLTAEHLLWEGAAAPLLRLAAIEAWTSHWA